MTATPVAAIETVDLTKRYGDVVAVDHLSFRVREGAITGFLGPNGAGKTTTLRMVLALARPSAGHATVYGRSYRELDDPARTVGANLEISGAHPGRSGRNHLRALAAMAGLPRTRVEEVLRLVDLAGAADRPAGKYSQGMRQRLGLAATLLGDPQLLVLDEPANGLDPQGIRWLREFLRGIAAEGRTVLISSHVLAEVAQTVDDVVVIHHGRLVEQGPVGRLTTGGGVLVRSPQAAALRAALEGAGISVTDGGDGALVAQTDDPARVGDLAFAAGVPVHELTPRATSLEEAFLALTSDAEAAPGLPEAE
jgi:ABC-2 type transport system ATP-binding protein